jgi:hypothetical protein
VLFSIQHQIPISSAHHLLSLSRPTVRSVLPCGGIEGAEACSEAESRESTCILSSQAHDLPPLGRSRVVDSIRSYSTDTTTHITNTMTSPARNCLYTDSECVQAWKEMVEIAGPVIPPSGDVAKSRIEMAHVHCFLIDYLDSVWDVSRILLQSTFRAMFG